MFKDILSAVKRTYYFFKALFTGEVHKDLLSPPLPPPTAVPPSTSTEGEEDIWQQRKREMLKRTDDPIVMGMSANGSFDN